MAASVLPDKMNCLALIDSLNGFHKRWFSTNGTFFSGEGMLRLQPDTVLELGSWGAFGSCRDPVLWSTNVGSCRDPVLWSANVGSCRDPVLWSTNVGSWGAFGSWGLTGGSLCPVREVSRTRRFASLLVGSWGLMGAEPDLVPMGSLSGEEIVFSLGSHGGH